METNAQRLRQKAINLLYLIFLAFLFSFIPSDFVDTTYQSNDSMNLLCSEVERQSNKYNAMILSYVREDEELFNDTKLKLVRIDGMTKNQIQLIEQLKQGLIAKKGFNKYGYLTSGKSENPSNEFMVAENKGNELFESLSRYKSNLSVLLSAEDAFYLDSILPLPELIRRSDGDYASGVEFYFKKNPLNVAILNLSHFKSRVERARIFTIGKIVQEINIAKPDAIPEEIGRIIMEDNALLGNLDFLKTFRLQEQPVEEEDLASMTVESVSDSVYAVGKPARFYVNFDSNSANNISVTLKTSTLPSKTVQMYKPGMYMFVPQTKGYYQLQFSDGEHFTRKYIKVMDLDPVLQNNEMGTLYIGLDNALNVKTSEFEDTEGLTANISNGEILKKGKNFYARVYRTGVVTVQIFAKLTFGSVKVAEKRFIVRELNPPVANILNIASGNKITLDQMTNVRTLNVVSEEYLLSEQFYVSSFEFSIIYNNHTSILQPIINTGSSLNTISTEALKRVKSGDVLIFNKIKAKSSLGKEIDVAPVTYPIE
jgi:GldM N-terminal domain/GldM C-terminal domain